MPNEATNFREAIAEDLGGVFLDPTHFAESVRFYPGDGGPSRTLLALVEASSQPKWEETQHELLEEVLVTVGNDAYDATNGGIREPRMGDRLQRAGETELYAWTGETRAAEGGSFTLVYHRPRRISKGGPHRRS